MPKYLDETGLAHFWSNIKNAFKDGIILYSDSGKSAPILAETKNGFFLFDCGESDDSTLLDNLLSDKLGDNKLKMVIITHYHSDHYGGFSVVADYCNAETIILEQMAPTQDNGEYSIYASAKVSIDAICDAHAISQPIVPTEGATYEFGDTILTLHNTTMDNRATYDTVYGYLYDADYSTLNNYSLIATISHNGNSFVYSGDIETAAQRLNQQYMSSCDVLMNPHHLCGNYDGYYKWYANACEGKIIANLSSININNPKLYNHSYLWRLMDYGYVDDGYIVGNGINSTITIVNNHVYFDGCMKFSKYISNINEGVQAQSVKGIPFIINPTRYISDNSYAFREIGISELRAISTTASSVYSSAMNDNIMKNSRFLSELNELTGLSFSTAVVFVRSFGSILIISYLNYDGNFGDIWIYSHFNLANKTGFKYMQYDRSMKLALTTPVGNGDNLSNSGLTANQIEYLLHSRLLFVRFSTGGYTVLTQQPSNNGSFNYNKRGFRGIWINDAMTGMLLISIDTDGAITMKTRNLSTDAVINAVEKIAYIESM